MLPHSSVPKRECCENQIRAASRLPDRPSGPAEWAAPIRDVPQGMAIRNGSGKSDLSEASANPVLTSDSPMGAVVHSWTKGWPQNNSSPSPGSFEPKELRSPKRPMMRWRRRSGTSGVSTQTHRTGGAPVRKYGLKRREREGRPVDSHRSTICRQDPYGMPGRPRIGRASLRSLLQSRNSSGANS